MSTDLKPCPFCGSAATLDDERLLWVASCTGCGACVLGDRAPEPEQEMPTAYWEPFRQSAVDRWNRRVALAQPEPEGPTDEEIMELMPQQMRDDLANAARALAGFDRAPDKAVAAFRIILNHQAVKHVRAVLARWGTPAIQPVPQPEPAATGGEFATTAEYALLELRGVVVDLCDAERWIAAERLEKVIDILGRHHALPTPEATS